jgi:hypothetical protein
MAVEIRLAVGCYLGGHVSANTVWRDSSVVLLLKDDRGMAA